MSEYYDCPICLEKVNDSSPKTSCGHYFHEQCLITWFATSRTSTCPMCRTNLELFNEDSLNIMNAPETRDNEWHWLTEPNIIVSINTFDDGNQRYQDYTNSWVIIGEWLGKVSLRNISNPTLEISSISTWKTTGY